MKIYILLFSLLFLALLFQSKIGGASVQLEYVVEIYTDGSARWSVEQRGTTISTSFESFDVFVKNSSLLVNLAREKTNRNMTAEDFAMNVNKSGSYTVVKYQFFWNGFAEVRNAHIIIGDVFNVEGFFSYLYGDGAIHVFYPSNYTVESVSPQPHESHTQTIGWYGIADFKVGEPKIVLIEKNAPPEPISLIDINIFLALGFVALVGAITVFHYHRRKKKVDKRAEAAKVFNIPKMESDEEKVISLLRAAGGRMYQSTIADQCGFSRSKTSKLLKAMEEKGKIRRDEKGREKVVTLIEKNS